MLPKKKRVTKETFQILIKEGKTFSTRLFLFHFLKNSTSQFAFVAPKKSFKNSVIRNKFRRIGYNILRTIPLKDSSGIFVYKKEAVNSTKEQIKEEIEYILNKIGYIDKK